MLQPTNFSGQEADDADWPAHSFLFIDIDADGILHRSFSLVVWITTEKLIKENCGLIKGG